MSQTEHAYFGKLAVRAVRAHAARADQLQPERHIEDHAQGRSRRADHGEGQVEADGSDQLRHRQTQQLAARGIDRGPRGGKT